MIDDVMSFEQFERIYETSKNLVNATALAFQISENFKTIPDELYVDIIQMHNATVDFINTYNKCTNGSNVEKGNKNGI